MLRVELLSCYDNEAKGNTEDKNGYEDVSEVLLLLVSLSNLITPNNRARTIVPVLN